MYQKTTLGNGLRIITEEIPYVKSATIGIWVGTGSRCETMENMGISHFIEHLLFKGTETRSAKQIAETVDAVGGQLNAFTAKEYTCYYIKVVDHQMGLAVDILSDMLFHPKFDVSDIEKERDVILEEIYMYEDSPDEIVHDLYMETVWPDHPLGRNILGTIDSLSATKEASVRKYYMSHYIPSNMVLAAAGNFKHDELVRLAIKYFGNGETYKKHLMTSPQFSNRIVAKYRDTEQMHICLGTPGLPIDHEQAYALNVLNTILGGGLSSRLFQSIREDRGLAYSVYSYLSSYQDAGLFTVYAGTRPANAPLVLELVQQEMKSMRDVGITDIELTRAKEYIKGNLLLGLENTSSRMTRLGKLELTLNKVISIDEVIQKVDKVTTGDVQGLAQSMFTCQNLCITALGPADTPYPITL
jgi:predicted Zn-dependent peptidase